jgi:hypothetical protein
MPVDQGILGPNRGHNLVDLPKMRTLVPSDAFRIPLHGTFEKPASMSTTHALRD